MIPSIETIVEDLVAGKITKSQAVGWLYQYAEGALDDLRDHFAGQALIGVITSSGWEPIEYNATFTPVSEIAYEIADAMLKERTKED